MTIKNARIAVAMLVIGLASASSIEARHNKRFRNDPLVAVAFDIENVSRHMHGHADQTAYRGRYGEKRALRRLHELEDEARDFRRALQRSGPYSHRTEHAWTELRRAWRDAQRSFPALRVRRDVRRDFRRLDSLMDDLAYRYETRLASRYRGRRGPGRGHGSSGYVQIGAHGNRGHASFGISWDD